MHDAFAYPQTKTSPLLTLGCEKWFEDAAPQVGGNAGPVVGERNACAPASGISPIVTFIHTDDDAATGRRSVERVDQQVGEHLTDLAGKDVHFGRGITPHLYLDPAVLDAPIVK